MATMGSLILDILCVKAEATLEGNWSATLGAIVTIFLSLFIIGLFVLGSALIEEHGRKCGNRVAIQAFLSDGRRSGCSNAAAEVQGWDTVESCNL